MKVLLFSTRFPPEHVGTALYTELLAGGLARRQIEVEVLAPAYGSAHPEDGERPYPVRRIPGGNTSFIPLRYRRCRTALRRALAEWRPDVLWAANGMATRVAGTLADAWALPVVGTIHGTDIARRLPGRSPWTWLESRYQRRFYARAGRLVTNTHFTRSLALAKGVDADKTRVIHLGVPMPEDAEARRAEARRRRPELAGRPFLLTVGRLVRQKGHRLLFRAAAPILRERPEVLHLVVGDGPERGALEEEIEALGLRGRICLLGRQSQQDLDDLYALARLFALTSHASGEAVEGMGFVFLEAASWGLPAVGTRHGGIPEAVEDGLSGFLVDPGDPGRIGACLARLLDDEEQCREMAARARAHVSARFGVERMIDESLQVLAEIGP